MYRNKKILELANEIEHCTGCGRFKDGTIIAAHSNQISDGKGMGIKCSDYRVAYLCSECHRELDQGKGMDKEHKRAFWEAAHRKTIGWLFESGHIKII